jgi:MYXO-CTERM domain-containing protein
MRSPDTKRNRLYGLALLLAVGAMAAFEPTTASAHFRIDDPAVPPEPATVQSWMSQDPVGGPQKNGPCAAVPNTSLGDSPGTPTTAVTVVQPGQRVSVPITVTIGHPGWFRIALAEGPSSTQTLATIPDPQAQKGTNCTPAIMANPVWSPTQPILADGLPAGSTASTQQTGSKTFEVTIPANASCSSARPCSLQVVMVMTDHPADDCYYHHCADISVAGSGVTDAGAGGAPGNEGAAGAGGGGGARRSAPDGAATDGGGRAIAGGAGATGAQAGSVGAAGGSTRAATGGSAAGGARASAAGGTSGCSCVVAGGRMPPTAAAAMLLALLIARRRRPR